MYILYAGFVQKIVRFSLENAEKMFKKYKPGCGLQMAPLVIKRCRGITADIPNMFPASGGPTAPPGIMRYDFSSFSHSSRELTDIPPWVAEIAPNHGFSRIFTNFPKIIVFVEK